MRWAGELLGVAVRQTEVMRHRAISALVLTAVVSCSGSAASGGVDDSATSSSPTTRQSRDTVEPLSAPPTTGVTATPDTDDHDRPDGALELIEPPCDDDASCALGFYMNGVFFGIDCTAIKPSAVTPEVRGAGTVSGQHLTAKVIAEIDPSNFVAVSLRGGGGCYDEDPSEPASPWILAIRDGLSPDTINDAVCAVADDTPERGRESGCEPLD